MPDLLFEIGVEELPALSIEPAVSFIKEFLDLGFANLSLSHKGIEVYGTPRRLVAMVDDLSMAQPDIKEEVSGPSVSVAFDKTGALSPAGLGFLRARGIEQKDVFHKKTDKGDVIAAHVVRLGQPAKELIPKLFVDLLRAIPFKKRMRWCASADNFARPIRWMVCLYDGCSVPLSYADVTSGNRSFGHRYMAPDAFAVTGREQYLKEMKSRFVILSSHEREAQFVHDAQSELAHIQAHMVADPELMQTVRNLMEYPYAVLGNFEDRYLEIPREILISELKTHQKCFAVQDKYGQFLPYFLCSAAVKPYDRNVFALGNARVVRARFEDGAFYFAQDKKKTLSEHALGLGSLVFERELGSMAQKSQRITKTALALADVFSLPAQDKDAMKRAAPLLKADLVSGVVGQFPELQGIMGKIYAGLDGESEAVCAMIEQHYWPRFADDALPSSIPAALLSIADKLDTVVGVISIGKKPSGNKDPFALRRCSISLVRMLVHFGLSIELGELIKIAQKSFDGKISDTCEEIKDFMAQRARGLLIEQLGQEGKEYAVNFADSVFAVGPTDMVDIFARAHTLLPLRMANVTEFESLTTAFKRASNIVKKAESNVHVLDERAIALLVQPAERDLIDAVRSIQSSAKAGAKGGCSWAEAQAYYRTMFGHIASLKPKLDTFFDTVMVMVDDKALRDARLALLAEIKKIADQVADFTHL